MSDLTFIRDRAMRRRYGASLREQVPLESHGGFRPDLDRDPLAILADGDRVRVPALVPMRYQRMAERPFAFYRGGAAIMARDLAALPRLGIPVQACGDCHLMNFGAFASPEGRVLFDINDFDETCPAVDFIVDLKRLAASVAIAAQDAKKSDKKAESFARATVAAYRKFMTKLAEASPLEVWNTRIDLEAELHIFQDADLETEVLETLAQAVKPGKSDKKTTREYGGVATLPDPPRFLDKPPSVFHVGADGRHVGDILSPAVHDAYLTTLLPERARLLGRYSLSDVAFKVVGVGSVGTFCAISLMTDPDGAELVLQLKQANAPAVAPLALIPVTEPHQGRRVVEGQRAMQAASDVFLGWTQDADGRHFYVRQLKNKRLGSLTELLEGRALAAYATLCGHTLARAHARTGDPAIIAGYIGEDDSLDQALGAFAMAYARQNAADYEKLVASGRGTGAPPMVPAG